MKGLKYTDNNEYESDSDGGMVECEEVVEVGLDEMWEGVRKRWKMYIDEYSLEMLDNYDQDEWGARLPELVEKFRKRSDDGWQ